MNQDELLKRVCATSFGYQALGNETWTAAGAGFVRNTETPRRFDANMIGMVRAGTAAASDLLLRELDSVFESFGHRMVMTDALTPRAFDTRLAMEDGYREEQFVVHVLEGELRASPRDAEIQEVSSEAGWEAYRSMDEMWWRESGETEALFGPYDRALHDEMMTGKRLKNPQVRSWLAMAGGEPRGFFSSWPGENGVGMIEDLFVHPESRHRGLATGLIAHCVADARERGAGPVLITSAMHETSKHMYAAMGFRSLYVMRTWTNKLGAWA